MTQTYTDIAYTDIVGESLDPLKNRDQANKTNFMGTSLPTVTADDIGMPVVIIKTENDIVYRQLWRLIGFSGDQPQWQLERDLNKGLVYTNNISDADITNYQPLNELLTSFAAQTAEAGQTNANKIPYTSANNTISLTDVTELARQFLAAVDVTGARSVLGLGTLATKNAVSATDVGTNSIQLSNLATGTPNHVIAYAANGQPTTTRLPSGVPVGSILMYPSTTLPDNSWIFPYGQQLSISEYSELWAMASASNNITADLDEWTNVRPGSFYQESSSIFRVPDLRNYFMRVWDGPSGPTRTAGSKQGDAIRNLTGVFSVHGGANLTGDSGIFTTSGGSGGHPSGAVFSGKSSVTCDASRLVPTAEENRPVNISLPFIMKAKSTAT